MADRPDRDHDGPGRDRSGKGGKPGKRPAGKPAGRPPGKAGRAGPGVPDGPGRPPGRAGGPGGPEHRSSPGAGGGWQERRPPWRDRPGTGRRPFDGPRAPNDGEPARERSGPRPPSRGGPPPDRGEWRPTSPRGGPPPDRGPWRPRPGGPPPDRDPSRPPRPDDRPADRGPWSRSRPGGPPPDRGPWRPPAHGGPPGGRPDRGHPGRPPGPSGPPARPGPGAWQRPGRDQNPWPRPGPSLPPPDLLGPDEELVAGRRPVEEVFAAGRVAHRLLVVPHRRDALEQLVLHATRLRIPIVEVEGGSLTAIAGFDGHQGVAVVVEPRRFATIDDILARARERDEPPFLLVLDSLEDPQNLGTLLRSAEAAGVHGVIFPTRRQAPLSAAAVKASAGATEHLLLCPVDDLPGSLADLHAHGLRVAGSEADAPLTARQTDLRGPLAIVVGSEGQGLGPGIRRRCDLFMRIPMRGAIGSLNAAVAGSVLLFEAVAQRDQGPAPGRPERANAATRGRVASADTLERDTSVEPGTPSEPEIAAEPETSPEREAAATPVGTAEAEPATEPATPPRPRAARPRKPKAPTPATDTPATGEEDLLPGGPPADPVTKPRKARTPRTPHA
ncbi:MAG: 23S rRNA (guanosine(2251)-2'-O)-methyltransferase RlmB [Chloroflexota bacterium]